MKALILVLSARREPWGTLMDCQRETWDAEYHPQAHTAYYIGGATEMSMVLRGSASVIHSTLSEELYDVSSRTIEAFECSLRIPDWNYLSRPHSSTYVHKRNLVRHLETLPHENLLAGLMTDGPEPFIWGGGHYIFSRDVIERFVEHKAAWRHDQMDDVAITRMAELLDIPVHPGKTATIDLNPSGTHSCTLYGGGDSFSFRDFSDVANQAGDHHFFRVKQDLRRDEDLRVMRELHKHLP